MRYLENKPDLQYPVKYCSTINEGLGYFAFLPAHETLKRDFQKTVSVLSLTLFIRHVDMIMAYLSA